MIRTKVAQIIDPTQVILAAGEADGVREGMEFIIYDLSEPVRDPETGEDLGRIELPKGRVEVMHVSDKLSVATTKHRTTYSTRPYFSFGLYREVEHEVQDKLTIDRAVAVRTDRTVRVGDAARSVD